MRIYLAVLGLLLAGSAAAKDIEITGGTQQDFESMSKDMVAAINYKAIVPAEATGLVGFGVGLILNYTPVEDKQAWQDVTGQNIDALGMVGLGVTKGLPFGVDVGAFYSKLPGTNVSVFGAEIRYAILEGGAATPAVALRGAYSKVSGIDSFSVSSNSFDVSVSKGFAFVTPYAGVGLVRGKTDPDAFFEKVDVKETRLFLGSRFSLGLMELTPEIEKIGDNTLYNLRIGFSFSL